MVIVDHCIFSVLEPTNAFLLLGDVVHLNILGRSVILLNSAESTTDLLENRTTIYSDRPRFPIMDM